MKPSERIEQIAQETHREMCKKKGKDPLKSFVPDIVYINAITIFLDEEQEKKYPLLQT